MYHQKKYKYYFKSNHFTSNSYQRGSIFFRYNESSASLTPWSKVLYHGLHEARNIETHSQDIGHKEQEANTTPKLWTQGSADHVLHRVKDNYWLI